MTLKVILPFQVYLEESRVLRIVAETGVGSCGFLPRRLDCVVSLAPGLLLYDVDGRGESYLAVDEGVLVKTGTFVRVSVRRAFRGTTLSELHDVVTREYRTLDVNEQNIRNVMIKMETGLLRRLVGFQHG